MIIGVYGEPGTGKTVLLGQLVEVAAEEKTRVRIADSQGSFLRYGRVYSSVAYYRSARTQLGGLPRVAVFHEPERDPLELACDVADLVDEEGGVAVFDEVDELVDAGKDAPLHPSLQRVALRGRKFPQTGLWYAAGDPTLVHRLLKKKTQLFYFLRLSDAGALRWVRANVQHGAYVAALLPTLPNGHYVAVPRFVPLMSPPVVQVLRMSAADWAGRARG